MSAAWLILISLVLNRCRVNGFGKETGGIICSANSAGNGNSLNLTLLASNNFSNEAARLITWLHRATTSACLCCRPRTA